VAPQTYLHSCRIGHDCYIGLGADMRWPRATDPDTEIEIGNNCVVWVDTKINKNVPDNCILTHHGRILKKERFRT